MSAGRGRVLVVGRDAEDTADTRSLLALVDGLAADTGGPQVRVLLQGGGPLVERFAGLAPTTVVDDLAGRSVAGLVERGLGRVGLRAGALRVRARRLGLDGWGSGDAVYLHTVLCVQALRYLPTAGNAGIVCRVPESVHPLDQPLSEADLALLVDRVDRFLVTTAAGVAELTGPLRVATGRVVRVPEVVAPTTGAEASRVEASRLRSALGFGPDDVVVGSFGASAVDPPSPAASLAVALRRQGTTARLLFVAPEHASDGWVRHDVECAGLTDRVTVVDAGEPLPGYHLVCDVVAHAGWGADHPGAYLEAMARGVPAVCFEGHELAALVGDDEAGVVCPYLDLMAMAEGVAGLVDDADRRRVAGERAADTVAALHPTTVALDAVRLAVAEVSR
ncbi:MAG: glycosyltransferase [Acidimicrobiales bacterium]|nr:glycosyltransferase [Acidimicrobiales bacterium]